VCSHKTAVARTVLVQLLFIILAHLPDMILVVPTLSEEVPTTAVFDVSVPVAAQARSFDCLCSEASSNIAVLLAALRGKPNICPSSAGAGRHPENEPAASCGCDEADAASFVSTCLNRNDDIGCSEEEEEYEYDRIADIAGHADGAGSDVEVGGEDGEVPPSMPISMRDGNEQRRLKRQRGEDGPVFTAVPELR